MGEGAGGWARGCAALFSYFFNGLMVINRNHFCCQEQAAAAGRQRVIFYFVRDTPRGALPEGVCGCGNRQKMPLPSTQGEISRTPGDQNALSGSFLDANRCELPQECICYSKKIAQLVSLNCANLLIGLRYPSRNADIPAIDVIFVLNFTSSQYQLQNWKKKPDNIIGFVLTQCFEI